jgi:hypothetical protein
MPNVHASHFYDAIESYRFQGNSTAWINTFQEFLPSVMSLEAQQIIAGTLKQPVQPPTQVPQVQMVPGENDDIVPVVVMVDNPKFSNDMKIYTHRYNCYTSGNQNGLDVIRKHLDPRLHTLLQATRGDLKKTWDDLCKRYGNTGRATNSNVISNAQIELSSIVIQPSEPFDTFLIRFMDHAKNAKLAEMKDNLKALLETSMQRPETPAHLKEVLTILEQTPEYSFDDLVDALSTKDRKHQDKNIDGTATNLGKRSLDRLYNSAVPSFHSPAPRLRFLPQRAPIGGRGGGRGNNMVGRSGPGRGFPGRGPISGRNIPSIPGRGSAPPFSGRGHPQPPRPPISSGNHHNPGMQQGNVTRSTTCYNCGDNSGNHLAANCPKPFCGYCRTMNADHKSGNCPRRAQGCRLSIRCIQWTACTHHYLA